MARFCLTGLAGLATILISLVVIPFFHRHRVSRTRRTGMGVRVVVGDGEPLGKALRRLKKLVAQQRRRRADYFIPQTEIRRAKAYRRAVLSRQETMLAKLEGRQ